MVQGQLDHDPFVYVTSRRWTARTTAVTTIKVYGTVDSVVLTLNGVALGPAKTSTKPHLRLAERHARTRYQHRPGHRGRERHPA